MKTWILILACCAFLCAYIGFECGAACSKVIVIPPSSRIPSIIELQEAIGAEPDGIVGPNTIAKWDYAYANQEAATFYTPSGGKEK